MVAVIADDLTGAAELGGIGLRQGLKVEIGMEVDPSSSADLLIIAADSRSKNEEGAIREMEAITRQLKTLSPEWIYKKTDSVLRGHVVAEMEAQMEVLGLKKALLVPANPALGRTIKDGHYYLHGQPVHQSSFALDPEFAITSSSVKEMLHTYSQILVRKHAEGVGETGITVGEVLNRDDLRSWAALADRSTLLAGAAGFFTELLRERTPHSNAPTTEAARIGYPTLFISGTTFGKNQEIIRAISKAGGPVTYMDAVSSGKDDHQLEQIINNLLDQGKAILAIEGKTVEEEPLQAARRLRENMADLVNRIMEAVDIEELVIEGGATAYAILEQAGLRNFFPEEELAPGVIRMHAVSTRSLYVTVKPGSYEWPESLLQRLEK